MRLSTLVVEGTRLVGDGAVEISSLACDSRRVRPGALFAALAGSRDDGSRYVREALARGAVALLGDPRIEAHASGVPVLLAAEPRRALALVAARFFGTGPKVQVAVTGTNGKSSTVAFVRQLWQARGLRAASLGTLGVEPPLEGDAPALTTPDPITLHRLLARLQAAGVSHLALEASSHGLDQRRLDGLRFQAAAFTHLSRDHLDYHDDERGYLEAKLRLFRELLAADGIAVVNADVPEFDALAQICTRRGLTLHDYGRRARRLAIRGVEAHPEGLRLALDWEGHGLELDLPLFGRFQAWNVAAALLLGEATGVDRRSLSDAARMLRAPRGRMERVGRTERGVSLFVDYAHTPDALEQALLALREHGPGRLAVVFGCGGDRDRGKRPLMGAVARRGADLVIVTDDNPRSEDPARIRREILDGAGPQAVEIGERREAIRFALGRLGPGDILLVAGKGHETGQIIGERVLPFDDAAVLRELAGACGEPA